MSTSIETDPKITVIYDNRSSSSTLKGGFGFSCVVEWGKHKILFDTGGDPEAFFANIDQLQVRLAQITSVVFSHHHWDHTAAFARVLGEINERVCVYMPARFSAKLERQVPQKLEVKQVEEFQEIDQNVYAFVLKGKYWCTTIYEQFLVLNTSKGLVILTGCAHPGIISIIQTAQKRLNTQKVHMVIGGFHLRHSWACTSMKVVKQFQELGVEKVAPCHCAGDTTIKQFEQAFGENFISFRTGSVAVV